MQRAWPLYVLCLFLIGFSPAAANENCTVANADRLAETAKTISNFISILEYTNLRSDDFPEGLSAQITEQNASNAIVISELKKLIVLNEDLSYEIRRCSR